MLKLIYTILTLSIKSKLNLELDKYDREKYFEAVFAYNLQAPFFMPHISVNWDI